MTIENRRHTTVTAVPADKGFTPCIACGQPLVVGDACFYWKKRSELYCPACGERAIVERERLLKLGLSVTRWH